MGLLDGLKRSSKKDDVPGTVEKVLDDPCPICSKPMRQYKKCCGSEFGYKGCKACDYKVNLSSSGV